MIKLAYPDFTFDSVVDGPGLRTVIWFQGCPHNCKGCHNPDTHDINGWKGTYYEVESIVKTVTDIEMFTGVTLSGGDPFVQWCDAGKLAKSLKERNINVWAYTGYSYEDLKQNDRHLELLRYVDVLVDGKFIQELKSYDLLYKGSSNQRIIDVQASLKAGKVVLFA